eukprot:TRINITY_DN12945_c0_g1_i1.p1 TRINITY_DN12945_c0_g1~~TRINITY_DN12945_c0_g1_i1.p1  ORF type:complete len:266 (+),score=28.56 TRINITY_DN12945_c0_g1_i1:69-800(+)
MVRATIVAGMMWILGETMLRGVSGQAWDTGPTSPSYELNADDPAFWDKIYRVHGFRGRTTYEWYGIGYNEMNRLLARVAPNASATLVVGAGDSELSASLKNSGRQVTSIDFSEEVVNRMQARHPDMRFFTMDVRNMSFDASEFNVVIDKGLADCLASEESLQQYFEEVRRVLVRPGGAFAIVSMRLGSSVFGPGWECERRQVLLGPQFREISEFEPAQPDFGTEGTIPYYLSVCRTVEDPAKV